MSGFNLKVNQQPDTNLQSDLQMVDPNILPPQIRRLEAVIGLPKTLEFLQLRGGTMFRFPISAKGSVLAELLGLEAASLLAAHFGGEVWELPKADKILIKIRNIAISEARKTCSIPTVAKMFNLTRRQVINISSDNAETDENRTADIFN